MQFIDLNRQYELIGNKIKERIDKVLDHKQFIMGEEVSELEKKLAQYTSRKHVLTCSSGTDALVIPLMAYGLSLTDAVFVPSFTFFASAESVNLSGGTPVFVDCDQNYNISTKNLENVIIKTIKEGKLRPRGIMAVDIFGLSVDFDELNKIAKKYDLFVIEDAAQGFGGVYKGHKNCSFGDISATSFFPAKPLGCYGDGGAIFTDSDELAHRIHSIRVHGQGVGRYDNIRIGLNGRMDTLQAAILLPKLDIFDEEFEKRTIVAELYFKYLNDYYVLPQIPDYCKSAWAQFSMLAKSKKHRDAIVNKLSKLDIPIMIYYEKPMHLQTAYKYLNYKTGSLPVCEEICNRIFSVPMHPYLTEKEICYIAKQLISRSQL